MTGNVRAYKIPNCSCGPPVCDLEGRVVRVDTCPACQEIRLEVVRGAVYACAYMRCGDTDTLVLVKQEDLFRS